MKHRMKKRHFVRKAALMSGACMLLSYSGMTAEFADHALLGGALTGQFSASGVHRALTGTAFTLTTVRRRIFTPNGDNINDCVEFVYENPSDAALVLKIFDLNGTLVAEPTTGAQANILAWDGTMSNGAPAMPGVYVYQIEATGSETRVINGVVVVAR